MTISLPRWPPPGNAKPRGPCQTTVPLLLDRVSMNAAAPLGMTADPSPDVNQPPEFRGSGLLLVRHRYWFPTNFVTSFPRPRGGTSRFAGLSGLPLFLTPLRRAAHRRCDFRSASWTDSDRPNPTRLIVASVPDARSGGGG